MHRRSPASLARLATAFALALALAGVAPAGAARADAERFATEHRLDDARLALKGAGILRWRLIIDAYAAALYLGDDVPAERVLDDLPKRLEIEYFHAIDAGAFVRATDASLPNNSSPEEIAQLAPRLARLGALYRDVRPGDRYAFTYRPGVGTELSLNGVALGALPGADLARALFAIWLGPRPLDAALKAQLLGAR